MPAVTDSRAGRARSAEGALIRAIGTLGLAAGIVNITIGAGIFRLPANVAASLGAAAPLAYVVCAVAMGLIVLSFAEAGSRVSLTGGPYAYVEVAFGPLAGFLCGVLSWVIGTVALAAVSTVFAANIAQLVPVLSGRIGGVVFLVAVFAFFVVVNIRGVRHGAQLNTVFTTVKLVPLLVLAIGGAFAIKGENLVVGGAPPASDVARTSMLLVFAFAGLETALIPGGEVKDPARTVPRAILLAMTAVTALYICLQVVSQGVLGPALGSQVAPLAAAADRSLGSWARLLLLVGAGVSMLGYIGGMTLAVPRVLFAFARDGFLPERLAAVHPRFRTPYIAIAVQAFAACTLAVTSTFEKLAILANLTTLILYGACCLAAWTLRQRGVAQGGSPYRVPGGGIIPWLACAAIAWMLTSIRAEEWAAVGIAIAVATIIYVATQRRRAATQEATA